MTGPGMTGLGRLLGMTGPAQATTLLTQAQWCLSECPDTQGHRDAFHKILDLCQDYAYKFRECNLQALLISNDFPCSMRAWTLIPHLALQELAHRKQLPRFITYPKDAQIRDHANRAPSKFKDPGNGFLDKSFYILGMWKFMTEFSTLDILAVPYREYGDKGNKSSQGPMNFRGHVLVALHGYCQKHALQTRK